MKKFIAVLKVVEIAAIGGMFFALITSFDKRVEANKAESTTQIAQLSAQIGELKLEVSILRALIPDAVQYLNMGKSISVAAKGRLTPGQIAEISRIIFNRCNLNQDIGIDPAIIVALIEQESNFDPKALSSAGAYGLMQVTRDIYDIHLRDIGLQFSPKVAFDPIVNVECGTRELVRLRRYWLDQGRKDWSVALNSYFWGIRGLWQLEQQKLKPEAKEYFYARAVIEKSAKWREIM